MPAATCVACCVSGATNASQTHLRSDRAVHHSDSRCRDGHGAVALVDDQIQHECQYLNSSNGWEFGRLHLDLGPKRRRHHVEFMMVWLLSATLRNGSGQLQLGIQKLLAKRNRRHHRRRDDGVYRNHRRKGVSGAVAEQTHSSRQRDLERKHEWQLSPARFRVTTAEPSRCRFVFRCVRRATAG